MPTPEMNVLFFYPVNEQPTFRVYCFPKADQQQLPVLAVALIQCAFEAPKLVPVFIHQDKTHFGGEFWNSDKHGELLILPPGVGDEDKSDVMKNRL